MFFKLFYTWSLVFILMAAWGCASMPAKGEGQPPQAQCVLLTTTLSAGFASIFGHPKFLHPGEIFTELSPERVAQLGSYARGALNSGITVTLIVSVLAVTIDSAGKWRRRLRARVAVGAGA